MIQAAAISTRGACCGSESRAARATNKTVRRRGLTGRGRPRSGAVEHAIDQGDEVRIRGSWKKTWSPSGLRSIASAHSWYPAASTMELRAAGRRRGALRGAPAAAAARSHTRSRSSTDVPRVVRHRGRAAARPCGGRRLSPPIRQVGPTISSRRARLAHVGLDCQLSLSSLS